VNRILARILSGTVAGSFSLGLLTGCGGGGPSTPPPPAAATLTILDGNNQTGTVGAALQRPLVVRVDDQAGHSLAGATVSWTVASGGGAVDSASGVTGPDGTASTRWTLGTVAGQNDLTAKTGTVAPAAFSAAATPGAAAKIIISAPGSPVQVGDIVQLDATAADAFDNPVPQPSFTSFSWTSSNTSVANVTSAGLLAILDLGSVVISAAYSPISGSLPINISTGITFSFGPEEIVFRYTSDSCELLDVPDVPAHAVRLADGTLMLADGDAPRNFAMFGADFSSLKRDCAAPTLVSDDDHNPDTYDNQEWIHSVYRVGGVIHALIHNEFHDPIAPNCSPGNTSPGNPCWYNSVGYASSADGGHTFTHATPPAQVVAPPPVLWDPTGPPPPHGYFNPSNIILAPDNFYYSAFIAIDRTGNQGVCVMRTQTIGNPASWRAWDGSAFNLQMTSPYTGPAPAMCTLVRAGGVVGSLTYNTYLGKYMLVSEDVLGGTGPFLCGFDYSLSPDLIHWTPLRLIRAESLPFFPSCQPTGGNTATAYPSIIDHTDATTNFEMPGRTPYLYFTRFNDLSLNRDLVRVPITITAH